MEIIWCQHLHIGSVKHLVNIMPRALSLESNVPLASLLDLRCKAGMVSTLGVCSDAGGGVDSQIAADIQRRIYQGLQLKWLHIRPRAWLSHHVQSFDSWLYMRVHILIFICTPTPLPALSDARNLHFTVSIVDRSAAPHDSGKLHDAWLQMVEMQPIINSLAAFLLPAYVQLQRHHFWKKSYCLGVDKQCHLAIRRLQVFIRALLRQYCDSFAPDRSPHLSWA